VDYDFRRPHRRTSGVKAFKPAFAAAPGTQPHAVRTSAMSMAPTPTLSVSAPTPVAVPQAKALDFTSGAKTYKRKILQQSVVRGLAISTCVLAIFIALAAAGGVYVNHKYSGRAIPFTYVGDVSIGGLSEQQIKEALDTRAAQIQVSFVDGGLVRTVPISQFSVQFDTAAVAYEATHAKFNPFAYLNKRRFEVAVTVNERQVNGYLTTTINPSKTASEDAHLVIDKKKLKIVPETQGFRTNPQFVNDRIKLALTTMTNPVVNVNQVALKPAVYATDLEDDLARANALVNTAVSLQYGKAVIKPTYEEKLSWLQITTVPGTTNVNVSFSKPLVRQYVLAQANKLQPSTRSTAGNAAEDMTLVTQKGAVIDNIDEATDAITAALNNGTSLTQALTSKQGTYNKLVSTN